MTVTQEMEGPLVVLALSQPASLQLLLGAGRRPLLTDCLQRLGCPAETLDQHARDYRVAGIQLGNEFCERLLPTVRELQQAQRQAQILRLELTLVTPMLTDAGMARVQRLLPLLAAGSEVIVNDWGTLQQLDSDYPALNPVPGRLLNKMIKDPRLPSAQWTRLHPHQSRATHFHRLLARFGIDRLEMDVPPFATPDHFDSGSMKLAVHLPYGYTVRGRMCRIGSLGQADGGKFVAAHACQKECLSYWARSQRSGREAATELYSFQRGNSWFYRHSEAMAEVLWQAVEECRIERLIFAGDWHENHNPAESA